MAALRPNSKVCSAVFAPALAPPLARLWRLAALLAWASPARVAVAVRFVPRSLAWPIGAGLARRGGGSGAPPPSRLLRRPAGRRAARTLVALWAALCAPAGSLRGWSPLGGSVRPFARPSSRRAPPPSLVRLAPPSRGAHAGRGPAFGPLRAPREKRKGRRVS